MSHFKYGFWLVIGSIFFVYSAMVSFMQVSSKLMQTLYLIDEITAGRIYSLPYYFLVVFAPIVGLYNAKYGNRVNIGNLNFLLLNVSD